MLILTSFWGTLVALTNASMVIFGIELAFFVFGTLVLFVLYSMIAGILSSKAASC